MQRILLKIGFWRLVPLILWTRKRIQPLQWTHGWSLQPAKMVEKTLRSPCQKYYWNLTDVISKNCSENQETECQSSICGEYEQKCSPEFSRRKSLLVSVWRPSSLAFCLIKLKIRTRNQNIELKNQNTQYTSILNYETNILGFPQDCTWVNRRNSSRTEGQMNEENFGTNATKVWNIRFSSASVSTVCLPFTEHYIFYKKLVLSMTKCFLRWIKLYKK